MYLLNADRTFYRYISAACYNESISQLVPYIDVLNEHSLQLSAISRSN